MGVGAAVVIVVMMAIAACSSENKDPPPDPTGSCAVLASRCHKYDKVSQLGHDCHELGHAGNDNACFPKKAECLAGCPETDGGSSTHPPDDSGASPSDSGLDGSQPTSDGGGGDGPSCEAHCMCLMQTCATEMGYPFPTAEQCKTTCNGWTAEEKICLPKWCIKAKDVANKTHLCEHAWGKLGTDECETLP
jgi:hypothetical protein